MRSQAHCPCGVALLGVLALLASSATGHAEDGRSGADRQVAAAVRVVRQVLQQKYGARPSGLKWRRGEKKSYMPQPYSSFGPAATVRMSRGIPPRRIVERSKGHGYFSKVSLRSRPEDHTQVRKLSPPGRDPNQVSALLRDRGTVPLQDLLSRFVRTNVDQPIMLEPGRNPTHPNCFGAALSFDSAETKPRFVSPEEFAGRLKRDFTMLRPGKDTISPRDRVVIWDIAHNSPDLRKTGRLNPFGVATPVHAATYLDANLLFSKGSANVNVPYQFEPYSGTFSFYLKGEHLNRLITVHRPRR